MDAVSARAVRTAFKRLYDDGLAYRTEALINWCPGCRTSVSDLEVIPKPEKGSLWTLRYHLVRDDGTPDRGAWISVATTRPETLLGDTAVAVHPEDPRYRDMIGRTVRIPFVERDVRVIADDVVDREFGTGAVKITPAHDQDDYATGRRHGLAFVTVLDDGGRVAGTGTPYDGMDRYVARGRIVADLDARGGSRGGDAARHARGALPAQRRRGGAAPEDAVVRAGRAHGREGPRGGAGRTHADPAEAVREGLLRLAREHPRLEREPAALVGPPDPRLVLPGRPRHGDRRTRGPRRMHGLRAALEPSSRRSRTSSTRGSRAASGRSRPWAGRTRRPTWTASTRARSWRRPTTSSSSGSRG